MRRYLLKRTFASIITVIGIIIVVFFIVRILPGDPALVRAGPYASEKKIQDIRNKFGLNQPIFVQFYNYTLNIIKFEFGTSIRTGGNVTNELLERLPASLELGFYGVLFSLIVGIPLGFLGASTKDSFIDWLVRIFAVCGSSMTFFWLGLMLTYFLFYQYHWFPGPVGRLSIGQIPPDKFTSFYTLDSLIQGDINLFFESAHYLSLPVITIGFVLSAPIIKIVRSSMIESLESDYVRTAKAMCIPYVHILFKYCFRNALLPITTTIGIIFGYMLGGNIIVELIFSWPGIGRYAYDAIRVNDIEALQGFVIMVGILYVILNIIIDLTYGFIDPRIKIGSER